MVGIKRSFVYKHIAAGQFPKPVKITSHASRWRQSVIEQWILSRELGDDAAAIGQQLDLLLHRYKDALTADNAPPELLALAKIVSSRPPSKRKRGRPRAGAQTANSKLKN